MGAEFMVQSANQMLGPGLSFAGRYRTDKWVATGTLIPSAKSVQATYFHKLDQTVIPGLSSVVHSRYLYILLLNRMCP